MGSVQTTRLPHAAVDGEELTFRPDGDLLNELRSLDRMRMEELQAVNQVLERANAELEQFIYLASHDLQEPLRKLVAFSELLTRDAVDLNAEAKSDLNHITDAARRMRTLIHDLVALSRIGRTKPRACELSLDACMDDAMASLSSQIAVTKCKIRRDALPTIHGDPEMITRLLENLIGNAIKFTAAGVEPRAHVTAERGGPKWNIGVRDEGIGIAPVHHKTIFQPFTRLHPRDAYPGSGTGLAMCKRIVERHGGTIWVESEEGKGSHFRFTIGMKVGENQWK